MSSKGQITLPVEVRERLGLKRGDRVEFHVDSGVTTLRPAKTKDVNPFEQFAGALPAFRSVPEINAWVREMRDDEA